MYVHLDDVHQPYLQRAPWYRRQSEERNNTLSAYDSEIHFVDQQIAELWKLLNVGDDDLVFIVSDHGEAFGDHGISAHEWGLYRELNRVLMMVHGPEWGVGSSASEVPVSLVDLVPTILDILGMDATGLPGQSLVPALTGETVHEDSALAKRSLFAHRLRRGADAREAWAAISDGWKLIVDDGDAELFHSSVDPWELSDVSSSQPDELERLMSELENFRNWARPLTEESPLLMDAERLEALKALGYVE